MAQQRLVRLAFLLAIRAQPTVHAAGMHVADKGEGNLFFRSPGGKRREQPVKSRGRGCCKKSAPRQARLTKTIERAVHAGTIPAIRRVRLEALHVTNEAWHYAK